jgi:hypothetical protein
MMLSLSQAADILGYSTSGLRKLVAKRAIQFFQAGPHCPIKFRREWLDEFIEAGSIKPGAPAEVQKRRKPKPVPLDASRFGFDPSLHSI